MRQRHSINYIPIIFFIILTFIAWKICRKSGLNPYFSILVFILAIVHQGLGLATFIFICIFAGLEIIKAKNEKIAEEKMKEQDEQE